MIFQINKVFIRFISTFVSSFQFDIDFEKLFPNIADNFDFNFNTRTQNSIFRLAAGNNNFKKLPQKCDGNFKLFIHIFLQFASDIILLVICRI